MKHLKRYAVPKNWPVPRKGTTFVVKPKSNLETGLPILVVLRDVLKVAKDRREVKKALNSKNVLLNGKVSKDERNSVGLFDVITIVPSKKNYKLTLSQNGKFSVEEIPEKDSGFKVSKIIGKKILKGKKVQLNLFDGRNFMYNKECKVNDSIVTDLKSKKVQKYIPLKEKAKVIVFAGKHAGKEGEIESIDEKNKITTVNSGSDKINVLTKQLMVTE
jgi:small subunit ribosomal protein S4e